MRCSLTDSNTMRTKRGASRRGLLPDRAVCPYCRGTFPRHDLEPDHDVPLALGGPDEVENIVVVCYGCNRAKGARLVFSEKVRRDVSERGREHNLSRILRQATRWRQAEQQRRAEAFVEDLESETLQHQLRRLTDEVFKTDRGD